MSSADGFSLRLSNLKRVERRKIVLWLALLAGLFSLWLAHAALLRLVALGLVVDQPASRSASVWIHSTEGVYPDLDQCYDRTVALWQENGKRSILLTWRGPCRLAALGVVSSFGETSRRELTHRGVLEERIVPVGANVATRWEAARAVGWWLRTHPHDTVALLCDRFRSRQWRAILDEVLGSTDATRVTVVALPDSKFDESNWWKSRRGAKDFYNAYCELAYAWLVGEGAFCRWQWDPDQFEQELPTPPRETGRKTADSRSTQ